MTNRLVSAIFVVAAWVAYLFAWPLLLLRKVGDYAADGTTIAIGLVLLQVFWWFLPLWFTFSR
jgi:hypothetical protein